MRFDVLTLFPDMFSAVDASMTGRAMENGIIELNVVNIRDYSNDKHNKTDDTPYGGGPGMVMMADPVFGALRGVGAENKRIVYMSPRGRIIDKALLTELAEEPSLVVLCGHYEGMDQRVLDAWDIEELSIGDYILTGGELPAMVLIDAVSRLLPGVLSSKESALEESIYSGLLEFPQYTRPREYEGREVPEILLSGDHRKIDLWRFEESLKLTARQRPDLFDRFVKEHCSLAKDEKKVMEKILGML